MRNNIAALREKKGLTQSDLARTVGVSRYHINKIENEKVNMSIQLASKIAHALGVTFSEIFLDDSGLKDN